MSTFQEIQHELKLEGCLLLRSNITITFIPFLCPCKCVMGKKGLTRMNLLRDSGILSETPDLTILAFRTMRKYTSVL